MTPEQFAVRVRDLLDDLDPQVECDLCAPWREGAIQLTRDGEGKMVVSVERVSRDGYKRWIPVITDYAEFAHHVVESGGISDMLKEDHKRKAGE